MKRATSFKVHRNFKLCPVLNSQLLKEHKRSGKTQTRIVEDALKEYLAIKR